MLRVDRFLHGHGAAQRVRHIARSVDHGQVDLDVGVRERPGRDALPGAAGGIRRHPRRLDGDHGARGEVTRATDPIPIGIGDVHDEDDLDGLPRHGGVRYIAHAEVRDDRRVL